MSKFLKAAACQNTHSSPPIWMMRQAGRYLPEYRAIREHHSFMQMMKNPDLVVDITLQPIRRYQFDAAILFSDILVTAEASGCHLDFIEKKGPVISNPVRNLKSLQQLKKPPMQEATPYVFESIKRLKEQLSNNTPLIGFCGAPFTVASYMIEGGSSANLETVKYIMGHQPNILHSLLDHLSDLTIDYLNQQIVSGVDALQIFDTWAGLLSWEDFKQYSFNYLQKIITSLNNPNNIPIALFAKGTASFLPLIAALNPTIISLDWQCSLSETRKHYPHIALQGNLDPAYLMASPTILKEKTRQLLTSMKNDPGYIFNLGHGITPKVPIENVQLLVDTVKNFP